MFEEIRGVGVDKFTEDHMLVVEPRARDKSEEKLGAIGVRASVSHGEQAWLGVLDLEIFVLI